MRRKPIRAKDQATLTISLPKSLKDEILMEAKAEMRSASNWVTKVISEEIEARKKSPSLVSFVAEEAPTYSASPSFSLPLVGCVAAGESGVSSEFEEEIQVDFEPTPYQAALKVDGPSMPDTAPDGSTILVSRLGDGWSPANGKVYVFSHDGSLTLKRFIRGRKGEPHQLAADDSRFNVEPHGEEMALYKFERVLASPLGEKPSNL